MVGAAGRQIQCTKVVLQDGRRLYYDVALSTAPSVFATLKDLVGTSHILFGTDYPLRAEKGTTESIRQFTDYSGFDEEEKRTISAATARELFPRFS